jgi:hypothetical protein
MQNSGTNLMDELLGQKCYLPFGEDDKESDKKENDPWYLDDMLWKLPGKHNPELWRLHHMSLSGGNLVPDQNQALPVIVVKDPYSWMGSMCRQDYVMRWSHTQAHCPNLVATTPEELKMIETFGPEHSIPVLMWYRKDKPFDSLAHVWNDWYGEYHDAVSTPSKSTSASKQYPCIMVRYKDLLFHAKQVVTDVCSCAGGKMRSKPDKLVYKHDPKGKTHWSDTGFVKAIVWYGNHDMRHQGFLPEDLKYAHKRLRSDLMDMFHYQHPPLVDDL